MGELSGYKVRDALTEDIEWVWYRGWTSLGAGELFAV